MKRIIFFCCLTISSSVFAKGTDAYSACYPKATLAVAALAERDFQDQYDKDGFFGANCEAVKDSNIIVCTVGASKGNGDATDTYEVIFNEGCNGEGVAELKYEE